MTEPETPTTELPLLNIEEIAVKKPIKREPTAETLAYRKLKKAAQNVIDLYESTHTVKSIDDFRYPGLRDLAEVLRS